MKKILIVDDEKNFAKRMSDSLVSDGYTVLLASDGEEGMVMVEKETPELIILDLAMPKLNGMDFLKMLNKDKDINMIPVLIMSNFSGSDKVNEGIEYGVRGFIVKSDESLRTITPAVESIIDTTE